MAASITVERTTAEWLALFKKLDIAAMPVNSIEDVIQSRHLEDVGFLCTVDHHSEGTLRQMAPAATWSDTPLVPGRPAPNLGEHSSEVLQEAGYTPEFAGTDNFADWTDPWPDLLHELAALSAEAKMPNEAVLQSATLIAARAAGQQRDVGSIEPGKLANMVVLSRNPLADLENLKSVEMTIKRGQIFMREAFVPLRDGDIIDR